MRLLVTSANEAHARRLAAYLEKERITAKAEPFEAEYAVWVIDEEKLDAASALAQEFFQEPQHSRYDAPKRYDEKKKNIEVPKGTITASPASIWSFGTHNRLTVIFCLFCMVLFFYEQTAALSNERARTLGIMTGLWERTPVQRSLQFDYTKRQELTDSFIRVYGQEVVDILMKESGTAVPLPPDIQKVLDVTEATPTWDGVESLAYEWFTTGSNRREIQERMVALPRFEKIGQGELWRLWTPIFLHADLFHLFVNILWVLGLGSQIERRIGPWRLFTLIAIIAPFSNLAQYWVGGANFLGASGVVLGLLTFIWKRQRLAPWEGYAVARSTMAFIAVYVCLMLGIEAMSFFGKLYNIIRMSSGVANTAHLCGAVVGFLLGSLSFFRWTLLKNDNT